MWHHVEVLLSLSHASYSVDGEHFATVELLPGEIATKGYIGMIRYDSNYAFKNLVIVDATGEIVFKQPSERKSADWMANEAAALKAASESSAAKKVATDAAEMPWSRGGVAQDWKPGDMESWGRGSVEVTKSDDAQEAWGRGSVEEWKHAKASPNKAAEEGHEDEAEKAQASNVAKKDS